MPLWLIIVVDYLSPKIEFDRQKRIISPYYYDAILYLLACLQFLIITLLIIYASQLQWQTVNDYIVSIVNLTVMRILVGTTSGSSAIIVAHELIHRQQRHMRFLGRLLLYTVCYEHFIIVHMNNHHPDVASDKDIATARLDENFKIYWKRVVIGQFKYAWHSELKRLAIKPDGFFQYGMIHNRVLHGIIIELFIVLVIFYYYGWAAAFIFLYQALCGVRLLETINYYQHWGLIEGNSSNKIAWVNQSRFTEYALIGLSNHINHHQNPACPYYQNAYSTRGPLMPYGYFVTNLWVKLNNKSYRQASTKLLKK
jgi:alkane 1-monooxygenase